MRHPGRILVVDDDDDLRQTLRALLQAEQYHVEEEADGDLALERLEVEAFDLLLCDVEMPVLDGMQTLHAVHAKEHSIPVILMTAFSTASRMIESTRAGAFDYLVKPFEPELLLARIRQAVETHRFSSRAIQLGSGDEQESERMVGDSPGMQEVFKQIGRLADPQIPVIIRGETGTGKELVARALLQHGPRADAPFVAVNCAAIPESLIESELFGHEKGAFTHALTRRIGRFEQASGGTLFLDEIGDLPLSTQVKLLRVLQDRTISRVGSNESVALDVRVISATHQNLEQLIVDGQFREDLFFRLNGATILLPPLRERPGDVQKLIGYFARSASREFQLAVLPKLATEARDLLLHFAWPGNVRQLEQVTRRLILDAQGRVITPAQVQQALGLPLSQRGAEPGEPDPVLGWIRQELRDAAAASPDGETRSVWDRMHQHLERDLIREALIFCDGNQSAVARLLGITRVTVREKVARHQLKPPLPNSSE